MPQSLLKILVHTVFSTKDRADTIAPAIENELFKYFHGIVENNNSKLIIAGSTTNHVHLLISFGKNLNIPELVGDLKRDSSKWMKTKGFENFYWQRGYGAFSVGQSQVEMIVRYIENQKAHHQTQDYKDEYRTLLRRYEIDYDERYVWD